MLRRALAKSESPQRSERNYNRAPTKHQADKDSYA